MKMTRKQIEECLNNFNWKWELESVHDEDRIFFCWRMKGFGSGSQVCLVLDWDYKGNTKGPLLVIADGKKKIIRRFSEKMAIQLATVFNRLLENRALSQRRHSKRTA